MKVQIDTREQNRIHSSTTYYQNQGYDVEVTELEVADYVFNDKVAFEFKTIADFVSSIQSGRVFNQAISMAETYDHNFVIIHGDLATRSKCLAMSRNFQHITVRQYLSAIASLNRYVSVIETYSPYIDESYYRMQVQAEKCLRNKPIVKKFPRKDKNVALNFLCHDIYGINYKKGKVITDTYNLHSLNDLFTLTKDKLMEIDGIGENTAMKILTAIHGELK